jgi:hypothetical protein
MHDLPRPVPGLGRKMQSLWFQRCGLVPLRNVRTGCGASVAEVRLTTFRLPKRVCPRKPTAGLVPSARERSLLPDLLLGRISHDRADRTSGFPITATGAAPPARTAGPRLPARPPAGRKLFIATPCGRLARVAWPCCATKGSPRRRARPYRLNPQSQKLGHAVAVRDVAVSFLTARAQGLLA